MAKKGKKSRKVGSEKVGNHVSTRDARGMSSYAGVFDFTKLSTKPEIFRVTREKYNRFNIIPFEIKTGNFPKVASGEFAVGDLHYTMEYYVHKNVNKEKDILCPQKNYGKPCPLCAAAKELWDEHNESGSEKSKKLASSLGAQRRSVFTIKPVSGEDKNKLMFFDTSTYIFGDELAEAAKTQEDGNSVVSFYEVEDEGKIVKFYAPKETKKPFKQFSFIDRKVPVPDSDIDKSFSFDEALVLMTYKEIKAFYYGDDDDVRENDEDSEDEEDLEEDEEEEEEVDESDDDEDDEDDEDSDEEEDEEDDANDSDGDGEEDDEDDEEEEEEVTPKKKVKKSSKKSSKTTSPSKSSKSKCPSGYKFGSDYGHQTECDDCDLEMDCFKARKPKKK